MSGARAAEILVEALPYIRRFAGSTVVVKYGGNAIAGSTDSDAVGLFAEDVVLMHTVGIRPIVVHGGGPQINAQLEREGKTPSFLDGQRVTDADTLRTVRMVLRGEVGPAIVSAINRHGNLGVAVSGEDAGLIAVRTMDARLGLVGEVTAVAPAVLEGLLSEGFIPVLSTLGVSEDGRTHNVNADDVAGAVAGAMGAEKVIYLTDIEGVRALPDDPASLVSRMDAPEAERMIADGTISGGMIPKVRSCLRALASGAHGAHILDGRVPHALLLELFTDAGVGTMIVNTAGSRP